MFLKIALALLILSLVFSCYLFLTDIIGNNESETEQRYVLRTEDHGRFTRIYIGKE